MYLRYSTVCRLIFALLLCSSFDQIFYDEERHQQRFEYIPFIVKEVTTLTLKSKLRIVLGSKLEKLKTISHGRRRTSNFGRAVNGL